MARDPWYIVGTTPSTSTAGPSDFTSPKGRIAAICAAWLLLAMAGGVHAAEWRITPSVQIVEEYTDNVLLVPADQRKSDFITQLNPALDLDVRGLRAEFHFNYTMQNLIYARDSTQNTLNHLLVADGKAQLVPDWLFLEAQAGIARQSVSAQNLQGIDPNSDNRNTTESRTYRVSPYVRERISNTLSYEVRYQRDHVSTDSVQIPASEANMGALSIRSGTDFVRTAWGIDYSKESVNYSLDQPTTKAEQAAINGRYLLEPRFGLLATIGHEKNDYAFTGTKPEGRIWATGFAWQPSQLTNLTATRGERFFGKTYALDFTHRTRSFLWNMQYSENISSARAQFLAAPAGGTAAFVGALAGADVADPVERARFVDNFIVTNGLPAAIFAPSNSQTNRNFLEKRLEGSLTYNTPKTTSILNLFRVDRNADAIGAVETGPGTDDVTANVNVVQTGGSLLINWRFAPRTGLDFSVGADEYRFRAVDRVDTLKYVRVGLHHQFLTNIRGTVDCRRIERDSNDAGVAATENAISAAVVVRF